MMNSKSKRSKRGSKERIRKKRTRKRVGGGEAIKSAAIRLTIKNINIKTIGRYAVILCCRTIVI